MINRIDNSIKIRRADVNDIQPIYTFLCDLVKEDFDSYIFSKAFMINIVKPNYIYLVAEYHSKVVGFLNFNTRMILHRGGKKIGEILVLYVKPNMRNMGIGKLLLDNIKMECKNLNVHQLELTTDIARVESHNFYLEEEFVEREMKYVFKIELKENENP
jgi:N-acetylglutamate synthase-like GNAT family acetyltransferase